MNICQSISMAKKLDVIIVMGLVTVLAIGVMTQTKFVSAKPNDTGGCVGNPHDKSEPKANPHEVDSGDTGPRTGNPHDFDDCHGTNGQGKLKP
jgi:hypothetical protein